MTGAMVNFSNCSGFTVIMLIVSALGATAGASCGAGCVPCPRLLGPALQAAVRRQQGHIVHV
jgi:hypothetical protein